MLFARKPRSWVGFLSLFSAIALSFAVAGTQTAGAATPNLAPPSGALYGAYVSGGSTGTTDFESLIGRKLAIHHHFWGWTDSWPTSTYESWDVKNGRIPMVSWDGPNATLDSITNGSQDAVIRSHATTVKNFGAQILIRWGYEMNGTWFAWSGSKNGNDPAKYVAAWRHIVDIFRSVGATNALWIWAPNVGDSPKLSWNHWTNYYPGDSYVDWVGIDGYNWGTTQSWSSWQSFGTIFGGASSIYNDFNGRKPIMIAESGSVEQGGNKGAWWKDLAYQLKTNFTGIKAVVFLNDIHNGTDWRAQTSSTSLDGYRAMVGDPWLNPGTVVAPTTAVAPAITGAAAEGQTLNSSTGTWSGSAASYAYQWSRCDSTGTNCAMISGATGASLLLGSADTGSTMQATVTATNSAGSATATSAATSTVAAASSPPSSTSNPTISGTPVSGQVLTSTAGDWTSSAATYAYQWERMGDYASLVKASSPVAYWRFGEQIGSVASDASGNANSGTYSNVTLGVPGAVAGNQDSATGFAAGSAAFGDRFDFAGNAPFSLDAWVKPTQLDLTYRRVFSKEAIVGGKREGFSLWLRSDGVGFERWTTGVQAAVRSMTSLPLNVYSHVVATYDGSTVRLYVNGTLVGSAPAALALAGTSAPFTVGAGSYGSSNFIGSVDEAAVYDRALSQLAISQQARGAAASGSWTTIAGATGAGYTVGLGDVGYDLHTVVTASNAQGSASAVSSATNVVPS